MFDHIDPAIVAAPIYIVAILVLVKWATTQTATLPGDPLPARCWPNSIPIASAWP